MINFEQILFDSIGKKIVAYEIALNDYNEQRGFVLHFDDNSKMIVHSSGSEERSYVTVND